ncbi:MAG: cytochrome P450 [Acidimicrobiia bacterium]|nr:cytochrome P450 [Acidimicrobiia bacterium]
MEPDQDREYLSAHERYRALRAEPGLPVGMGGRTRTVTRYDDVDHVLRQIWDFGGSMGYNPDLPEEEQILPSIPEPRHGRIRRVINGAIAPSRLKPVEPYVRDLTRSILTEIVTGEAVDVVPTLVDPIPVRAMTFTFGIPEEDADRFRRMSDEMVENSTEVMTTGIGGLHPEFSDYVDELIAERLHMTDRPNDVMTRLIEADLDGQPLSPVAVRTQMMILILAGNETTRNLLGNLLYSLARAPDLFAELRRDPTTVAEAIVEESLRIDAPVQSLFRTCVKPTPVGDTELDTDTVVQVCLGSANRDNTKFDDPDEFRIDRTNQRDHLSFGAGPHICPGATLARMEARIVLEELADRVSAIRPAPDQAPEFAQFFIARGLKHLWLRLDPA